jgi:peptidoglycan LD-endopeptidase LytH
MKCLRGGQATHRHAGRSGFAVILVVALLLPIRGVDALTSDQVAAQILRVQDKADALAQQWADTQRKAADLAAQLATAETKLAETTAQFAQIEGDLTTIAIERYTGSSGSSIMILSDDPVESMKRASLQTMALDLGSTDLDVADAVRSDLAKNRAKVADLQQQNSTLAAELTARQAKVEEQLTQLATLRDQLNNEEVKRAYEQQLAAKRERERQQQAEQQRQAAVAAAVSAASRSAKGAGVQALALVPVAAAQPAASSAPAAGAPPSAASAPVAAAPAPAAPAEAPAGIPANISASWICPINGPRAFGDTWGATRPGGRHHQGVDMMSPEGTPLVAVVSGLAKMKTDPLGGNVVGLKGNDGNYYYYAHLTTWEGGSRDVSAGEVVGYVGHTGDTVANHLHFEIHPGGGSAINPYPTVRQYC